MCEWVDGIATEAQDQQRGNGRAKLWSKSVQVLYIRTYIALTFVYICMCMCANVFTTTTIGAKFLYA